jgi:hypothetical protein
MNSIITRIGIGVAGGIAGLVAMSTAKRLVQPFVKDLPPKPMDVFPSEKSMSPLGTQHGPDESATDALGRMGYQSVVGHDPSPKGKRALSWGVHIAYGLFVAGLYGLIEARERHTLTRALGTGALFGAGLWLIGDELVVPLLGLQDKPTEYSASRHAQALAAHLGFGLATGATTQILGRLS